MNINPNDINEYDDLIKRKPTSGGNLSTSIYVAAGSSPDEESQLRTLSTKVGIPVEALRAKSVKDEAQRAEVVRTAESSPPATAAWLSNPDNAAIAHDDIAALANKEDQAARLGSIKTFFTHDLPNLATSYGARMGAQIEQGFGGLLRFAAGPEDEFGHKPGWDAKGRDLFAEGKAIMNTVNEEKPLTTRGGRILGGVVDSVGAMLPGIGAGLVTASPAVGLTTMGLTTGGQSFGEKREAGKPYDVALKSGIWQGGTEVATEVAPFLKLAKFLKPGKMSRKIAGYIMADTAGEMIATALQNSGDIYFDEADPSKKIPMIIDYLTSKDFVQDEIDTILTTVAQGFIMGAPFAAGRMGSAAYERHRAKSQGQAIEGLLNAEDSKLFQRSPEVYGQALQQIADEHGTGTIYLQADRMVQGLQEQGLSVPEIAAWAEDKGISRGALDTAISTGSAVEFKVGDVASKMGIDPHLALFQKDWTLEPGAASEATVDGALETDAAATKRIDDLMAETDAADKKVRGEEATALARQLSGELVAAGHTKEYGDAFARTALTRANLVAQLTGVDAVEHLGRMGIKVTRQALADFTAGQAGGAVLEQATPRPPVSTLTGEEISGYLAEGGNRISAAQAFYREHLLNKPVTRPEVGEIKFTGKGFKKLKEGKFIDDIRFAMVPAIRAIVSSGEYLGREEVKKQRKDRIVAFHKFAGGVDLGGVVHRAEVSVAEDDKGNLFYTLYRKGEEKRPKGSRGSEATGLEPQGDNQAALEQSIAPHDEELNITILGQDTPDSSPRGALTPENMIVLFEGANLSTALHELGHVFLKDLQHVASAYGIQEKEWAEAKAWLGIEGEEITREQHEKFARHFEAYLREGEAPADSIRKVFQAFKKWMTRVYASVQDLAASSGIEINLTPEVRDLFDRLLATQEEIEAARRTDAQVAMLDQAAIDENLSPEEAAAYRATTTESESDATEKMDAHRVRGREERLRAWRKQAEETVSAEPLRVAIDKLCRDETGVFGKGPGINRETLRPYLGDEGMKKVPNHAALWRTEGLDVEHAAAQAGYEDARQFVNDLVDAGTKDSAVQNLVESLEAAHDADLDTQEAIRTAASRRQMEMESKIMAKIASGGKRHKEAEYRHRWEIAEERLKSAITAGKAQSEIDDLRKKAAEEKQAAREAFKEAEAAYKAVGQKSLRAWAEEKVQGERLSDALGVHKLIVASRQSRMAAMAAAKKGDWTAAFKANEKARIAEALIAQHYKAAAAYRKMQAQWKRAIKAEIAIGWRDQVNQLLTKFFMTSRDLAVSEGAPSLSEFFAVKAAQVDDINIFTAYSPAPWIVDGAPMQIKDMTWGQVLELNEAMSWLVGHGRAEMKGTLSSRGVAVADAVSQCVSESEGLPVRPPVKDTARLAKSRKWVRNYFAELSRLSRLMKWMDGFKNIRKGGKAGANERLVLETIRTALGEKYRENERLKAMLDPHFKQLIASAKKHPGELTHAANPDSMMRYGKPWTVERVVAFALNMGTEDNYTKLKDGYWLTDAEAEKIVSILTEADWRAIEGIWQAENSLWAKTKEVHEKINFFPLRKTPGRAFAVTTADGKVIGIQGMYHPLRYDSDQNRNIGGKEEKNDLLDRHGAMLQTPTAKSGMTKGRVKGVVRPVKLSLSVVTEHIEDSTTYIHMALPIMDADGITKSADYLETAEDVMGKEMADQIRPALVDILRRDGRRLSSVEQFVQSSKRLVSFYYIGWNLWSAVQNVVNIFPVLKMTGARVFADGFTDVFGSPRESHRKMVEKSAYMAERDDSVEREMKRQWAAFKPEFDVRGVTLEDVRNSGFALMKLTDTMFTLPMWWGSYNEGLRMFEGDEAAAIAHADGRVATVFGSGMTLDQSMFQRDPGWQSLLTTFASWFMTQQQMIATDWQAMKAGETTKAQFAYDHAMIVIFPSIATTYLFSLLTKGEPPEWEEILADLGANYGGGLPLLRDLIPIREMFGKRNRQPSGLRIPAAEVAKDVQKAFIHAKDLDGEKLMWDMFKLASYRTGIPASRKYEQWKRGSKQGLPQNVLIPARN